METLLPGSSVGTPRCTPLHNLHVALGAKLVPFAGWELPVQYDGILAEHRWTRDSASLFDVSHMGQVEVSGDDALAGLESLIPASLQALAPGRTRYAVVTNDDGGIVDDLLLTHRDDDVFLVINAARIDADLTWFRARLPALTFNHREERALLALQGPKAADALSHLTPAALELAPFAYGEFELLGVPCTFSRSGYTGEDGFEISCDGAAAVSVAEALLARPEVRPAGLGARDSLRLEAGLCLYGSDINADTSPVEAGLAWTFGARRRGRHRGARRCAHRARTGDRPHPQTRGTPARGAAAWSAAAPRSRDASGHEIGEVTSGTFSPSLGVPIAMGYVATEHSEPGAVLQVGAPGTEGAGQGEPTSVRAPSPPPKAAHLRTCVCQTLRYTKDHEWVTVDGDIATVGITEYAQDQLGDIVFVELPEVGRTVAAGEEVAVVESVKAASEVYAPVAGAGRGDQPGPWRRAPKPSMQTPPATAGSSGSGWPTRESLTSFWMKRPMQL